MIDALHAQAQVQRYHSLYADAVWRRDLAGFGDCFTVDAEWRLSGRVIAGREAIVAAFDGFMADTTRVLMTFRTPLIGLESGEVCARTSVSEDVASTARPSLSIGTYYERFVDEGDRWRCRWRLFQLHYLGPPDMSGAFFETEDYGPPPAMPPQGAVPPSRQAISR